MLPPGPLGTAASPRKHTPRQVHVILEGSGSKHVCTCSRQIILRCLPSVGLVPGPVLVGDAQEAGHVVPDPRHSSLTSEAAVRKHSSLRDESHVPLSDRDELLGAEMQSQG